MKSLAHNFTHSIVISTLGLCATTATVYGQVPAQIVGYFDVSNRTEVGIGFPGGGKSLYVGGCGVFNLQERRFENECIYPDSIRWAAMSPDGSRLLATVTDKHGKRAKSLQIDATTGRILTTHPGIYFAPPVAIDPSNGFWIAPQAGAHDQGGELLKVTAIGQWEPTVSAIFADVPRIFSLMFAQKGRRLIVNGGPPAGSILDATDWSMVNINLQLPDLGAMQSHDGRFRVNILPNGMQLVKNETKETLVEVELDMSREDPQLAFSWDGKWFAAKGYRPPLSNNESIYSFVLIRLPD